MTEALTAGVPMLVLPLSTDQFAAAAAIEDSGFGEALDPNSAEPAAIRESVRRLLPLGGRARAGLDELSRQLRDIPGPRRARDALLMSRRLAEQ